MKYRSSEKPDNPWLAFCGKAFAVTFGIFIFAMFSCLFPTGVASTFSTLAFLFALIIFIQRIWYFRPLFFEVVGLSLFFWLALSIIWTDAGFLSGLKALAEYRIYVMVPVFAYAISASPSAIKYFAGLMLLGCLISLVASYLLFFDAVYVDDLLSLGNSIFHGFIMSLLYFAALLIFRHSEGKIRILFLFIALVTAFNVLFVEVGRTGYLQITVATIAFMHLYLASFRKQIIVFTVFLFLALLFGSLFVFHEIEALFIAMVEQLRMGQHGYSNMLRLDYYSGGLMIGADAFPWGVGVGDAEESLRNAFFDGRMAHLTDNVHSEFLNMWLVGGLPGLVMFLLFIFSIIRIGTMVRIEQKGLGELMFGFGCIILTGALFNSVIKDFGEKHVILIVLAMFSASLMTSVGRGWGNAFRKNISYRH